MPLRVIGAGFGRTGTTSLKSALETLGFGPCDHMQELFRDAEHADRWDAAVRGEAVDWEELFAGYRSTLDWPGCTFYEELMERYPDAKVLLTVRDADRWYESAYSTIYNTRRPSLPLLVLFPAVMLAPGMRRMIGLVNRIIWEKTFGGNFGDRRYAIGVFEQHNRQVIERVPAERLLVYEVKEGWGPLCKFLGVDVPDKPFPHINDTETFRKIVRWIAAAEMTLGGVGAGLILLRWRGHLHRDRP